MRNRVRELRGGRKLTQEAFGRQIDVSRQTVISIEAGKYSPSLELAIRIARLFETTVEEVFLLDDQEQTCQAHAE